ncbi:MAG: hypothetical protein ACE367_18680 [Acidimicrobiales bacterium]
MLVFVTSVRHPHNSNSYDRVWKLLSETITSVTNQQDDRYEVVVVVNDDRLPPLPTPLRHPKVHVQPVGFPPPSPIAAAATDMASIRVDRGAKYAIGLLAAERFMPDHVMFFDADDFVSRRLSGLAASDPNAPGWVIREGWWLIGRRVMAVDRFYTRCGTCNLLRYDVLRSELARTLSPDASLEAILETVDPDFLRFVLGSHKFAVSAFEEAGIPLATVPFRAAIRNLQTGENHSDLLADPPSAMDVKARASDWQPVDESLATEFALPPHHRPA